MRELRGAMHRMNSVHGPLFALYLILLLMISSGRLVQGAKEQQASMGQLFKQQTANRTSANSFMPMETSKSINRLATNSTTGLNRKHSNDLLNINTHETSSSTQQSFFDTMNRDKDSIMDANYLMGIPPDSPDSNYFTSDSKLINHFRQPLVMNEYDIRSQLSPVPFAQVMTSDASGPQVYEAQTNYPIGGATHHLENSFYVNMMGPQQVGMSHDKFQDEGGSSNFHTNQYANPTNEVYAQQNYLYPNGNISPQDYAKQAYIIANQQRFDPSKAKDQIARNQKILTNAQIVSLIDELKEFNSRKLKEALSGGSRTKGGANNSRRKDTDNEQASKINRAIREYAKNLRDSKNSQDNDSDDEAKKRNNNSDDDQDSDDESERREDDAKNEDDDELKKEDLQKLASFIFEQQKENNRLLNARRKNEGSDGDDEDTDMRDTLLENSRRSQANEEPQSSVKNSKEVPNDNTQLLELLKKLSTKTNVADDSNSYEDNEKTNDQDDSDRARKRRANEDTSSSTVSLKKINEDSNSPLLGLINQNLDRYQTDAASILPKEESMKPDKEVWVGRKSLPRSKHLTENQVDKRVGDIDESNGSSSSSNQEGEEESEYPRSERMKDLETLRQGLARSREAQLKLSRIPLPLTPLFKEALNNELTKVTDQTIIEMSGNEDDKADPKNERSRDEPEVGEESTNSDLSPSRAEPDSSARKVKNKVIDHQIGEEYPISETVNDRINKLSHNLDRYFNDGFLNQLENKSLANVKSTVNQGAESRVRLQVQPKKSGSKVQDKKKETVNDDDFDINVAIDGKRDTTELEDELNEADGTNNKRGSIQKSTGRSKRLQREKTNSVEKAKKIKGQKKESAIRVGPMKARRHAINHGADQQQQQKHQYRKTVNADPVDSETLDTPIGPDNKKQSKVAGSEKSKGFKEKLSNYSRNGEKFFQEPD